MCVATGVWPPELPSRCSATLAGNTPEGSLACDTPEGTLARNAPQGIACTGPEGGARRSRPWRVVPWMATVHNRVRVTGSS